MTLDTRYSGRRVAVGCTRSNDGIVCGSPFDYFVLFYRLFAFIFECGKTNVNSPLAPDYFVLSQTLENARYNFDKVINNFIERAEIYTVI